MDHFPRYSFDQSEQILVIVLDLGTVERWKPTYSHQYNYPCDMAAQICREQILFPPCMCIVSFNIDKAHGFYHPSSLLIANQPDLNTEHCLLEYLYRLVLSGY